MLLGIIIKLFNSKTIRVFLISISFHLMLFFSTSNKITLVLSILLLLILYQHIKKLSLTIFYVFLITLPFAKGKGIDILLLEKKYILKNALFDITYLFPIYLSSFYLVLFYVTLIRKRIQGIKIRIKLSKTTKIAISFYLLFIITVASKSVANTFEIPIFLSAMQLLLLLTIFLMPFFLFKRKSNYSDLIQVIASSTLFQSIWLILQTINQGHLGKDIEVFLFETKISSLSSENSDLLRLPGTFFESSILGTFLLTNMAIMIFVYLSTNIKDNYLRKIIITSIFFAFIAIILTGSRAIYLILIIMLLILGFRFFSIFKNNIKHIIKSKSSKILNLIIFVLIISFVGPYFFSRLQSINRLFTEDGSGTYRIQLIQYALRLAEKEPLMGVGLNLSPYYFASSFPQEDYFVDPAHPHNLLAQLLAETGIIGLSLFSIFMYILLRPVFCSKKANSFHFGAIIFFLCAQIYPIFINHMEIISFLFLYLGLAVNKQQHEE